MSLPRIAGISVALTATFAAAVLAVAQPAAAVNSNLECQPIGNQQLACDLYKSGKSDYVSTTWELYGSYYTSGVNFVTINCPAAVVDVSASWTDSSGYGGAEFLRNRCY